VSLAHRLSPAAQAEVDVVRRASAAHAARWHETLRPMPRATWPAGFPREVVQVWRSRDVVVQVYGPSGPGVVARLSICGTALDDTLDYATTFSWESLQAIKDAVGYAAFDALEVFPRAADVVNVANMRHLWVVADPVPFAWRRG